MGALVSIARATESIGNRLASIFRSKDVPAGFGRWLWPTGNGDRGPPGSWQMNMNATGQDPSSLVAFSAVYSCVQKIAGDMAKLPIRIVEVLPNDEEIDLKNDPFEVLLRAPNQYQTRVDLIQSLMGSTLLQGNSYVLMKRNGRNEPDELHAWDPRTVEPVVAQDGSVFYRMGANRLAGFPNGLTAPARDVIHHRLPMGASYPLFGVTPIYAAAASSAMGLRILQQSQTFFGNMARPSGLLSTEQNINKEAAAEIGEKWKANYRDGGAGDTAVLGFGMKWQALTLNAVDSQLIEQLRYSVEDVCRVFHVPAFLIGDVSKVTYRNSEQLGRAYLQGCLGYHVEALQERLNNSFDFGNRFKVIFDLDALLKTEITERYTAYQQALQAGWLQINEVRALEGYGPVPGGDENMLQSQNQPLSVLVDNAHNPPPPPPVAPPVALPAPAPAPAKELDELDYDLALVRKHVAQFLEAA